jgi:hypothetical protein
MSVQGGGSSARVAAEPPANSRQVGRDLLSLVCNAMPNGPQRCAGLHCTSQGGQGRAGAPGPASVLGPCSGPPVGAVRLLLFQSVRPAAKHRIPLGAAARAPSRCDDRRRAAASLVYFLSLFLSSSGSCAATGRLGTAGRAPAPRARPQGLRGAGGGSLRPAGQGRLTP